MTRLRRTRRSWRRLRGTIGNLERTARLSVKRVAGSMQTCIENLYLIINQPLNLHL